jgi:hypothetical protein
LLAQSIGEISSSRWRSIPPLFGSLPCTRRYCGARIGLSFFSSPLPLPLPLRPPPWTHANSISDYLPLLTSSFSRGALCRGRPSRARRAVRYFYPS